VSRSPGRRPRSMHRRSARWGLRSST
jgi:hypothetical protein